MLSLIVLIVTVTFAVFRRLYNYVFLNAVSIREALYALSISQNIYLCTFWDADMSMVLQCTLKYQVLLDEI